MIKKTGERIWELIVSNKNSVLIFLISFFTLTIFATMRLYLTDEAVILDQFYNLLRGSLSLDTFKINVKGIYLVLNNHAYGKFSYSLPILSLPVYYILRTMDFIYGAHLFLLQLWALSGGIIAYFVARTKKIKYAELFGVFSYFILIAVNMYYFKPIYFPKWGEWLSIEFTNIIITSLMAVLVYLFFKKFFSNKIAFFASLFVIFATPISFYAITLKHHTLSLFLTMLAFYFFYRKLEKNNDKYSYLAYIAAGLCIWTRILDGMVLLAALLVTDVLVLRRGFKYLVTILIIIIISLIPFFTFNYLILGSPFSIVETTELSGKMAKMQPGQDVIILNQGPANPKQTDLFQKLGYSENVNMSYDSINIILDITFLRLQNTFGIFLVSPFIVIALCFVISIIRRKTRLNSMDKFFIIYIILFIPPLKNYLISIILYTSSMLEYRYLLIMYIILLYFALRIDKIKDLIETGAKKIIISYVIILIILLIYFIKEFPVQFMNIYYYMALITSISLLVLFSTSLLAPNEMHNPVLDNLMVIMIALSLAESSIFLLYYNWAVSMIYIPPSLDISFLPVTNTLMNWIYHQIYGFSI